MEKHFHMLGINGIGLSGVARILLEMGHKVTGSDPVSSEITHRLQALGAVIYHEHHGDNLGDADCVVVSSAIACDNPEVIEARRRGIPIRHRAQILGYIMSQRTGIAISGTHGKTTTSSMMANMLYNLNIDPTVVIGGRLHTINTNARLGTSPYMVVEADESDASFLHMDPRWIVVTSVDVDVNLNVAPYSHLNFDYDKTLGKVKEAFFEFIDRLPEDGRAILCIDDDNIRDMLPQIQKPYLTYGFSSDAHLQAQIISMEGFGSVSRVYLDGRELGLLKIPCPGRHNVANALAVIGVGLEMGLDFEQMAEALYRFNGVGRRFEKLGEYEDIMVFDDYAHNPGKIRALLHGARTGGRKRVVAVFQPHRYTRTKFLFEDFTHSFGDADTLVITDIYPAGECPIVGVRGETLARAIENSHKRPEEVYFIPGPDEIVEFLEKYSRPGDIVITCGAGDIHRVGTKFAQRLPRMGKERLAAG